MTYDDLGPIAKRVYDAVCAMSNMAGKDGEYANYFWNRLIRSKGIYSEFAYYAEHGDFACQYSVEGCSVVDIMVWQVDHFKTRLDRDTSDYRNNPDFAVLAAFETFLSMEEQPDKYLGLISSECGIDIAQG